MFYLFVKVYYCGGLFSKDVKDARRVGLFYFE